MTKYIPNPTATAQIEVSPEMQAALMVAAERGAKVERAILDGGRGCRCANAVARQGTLCGAYDSAENPCAFAEVFAAIAESRR